MPIVGERNALRAPPREQRLQVLRSLLNQGLNPDMMIGVESVEVVLQQCARALQCDVRDGNDLAAHR